MKNNSNLLINACVATLVAGVLCLSYISAFNIQTKLMICVGALTIGAFCILLQRHQRNKFANHLEQSKQLIHQELTPYFDLVTKITPIWQKQNELAIQLGNTSTNQIVSDISKLKQAVKSDQQDNEKITELLENIAYEIQTQDRVSQILEHVTLDMAKLPHVFSTCLEHIEKGKCIPLVSEQQWIEEFKQSFTTAEQHQQLNGELIETKNETASTTFF